MAMTGMAIAAIAAPAVGGIVGNLMGSGDRKRAEAAIRQALSQYDNINIPDTEKMKLALESPEVQGILQPFLQQAEQLAGTSMEDIAIDPRLRQAQMQALETLSQIGSEGLTAADRLALNQARRSVAADAQSRQEQILQNMAQRGIGGSGMELAAKLQSNQEQADRASQESDRIMAMAQERMLQGVTQAGQTAGSIRGQEYGEQSELARAKDLINQFNLQQRAGVQASNVGALNEAQMRNLAEQQRVYEAGVQTRNAQQQHNKELLQREFDNKMALASARANALGGAATQYQRQADATANMYSGIGEGLGQMGMAYATRKTSPTTPTSTPTMQKSSAPASSPTNYLDFLNQKNKEKYGEE